MSGRPSNYPWTKWFKSKNVTLSGEDYTATQRSMLVMIRHQARLHSKKVKLTRLPEDGIQIEVLTGKGK